MSIIIKGRSIMYGKKNANHYFRGKENEAINVCYCVGFATNNAEAAFEMMGLMAIGSKCKKPLYSMKISPDPKRPMTRREIRWTVNLSAKRLNLAGHPHILIEHTKKGRVHYHALFFRQHPNGGAFKNMGNDYYINQETQREVEKAFQLSPMMARGRDFRKWEVECAQRHGFDIFETRDVITKAFNELSDGKSFHDALHKRGITLCRGEKSQFVLVLPWGQHKALSSMVYGRPTKAILTRGILADGSLSLKDLPTVQEAKQKWQAEHPKHTYAAKDSSFARKHAKTIGVCPIPRMEFTPAARLVFGPSPLRQTLKALELQTISLTHLSAEAEKLENKLSQMQPPLLEPTAPKTTRQIMWEEYEECKTSGTLAHWRHKWRHELETLNL